MVPGNLLVWAKFVESASAPQRMLQAAAGDDRSTAGRGMVRAHYITEGPSVRQGPCPVRDQAEERLTRGPGAGTHAGFSEHRFLEQNTYLYPRAFLLEGDEFPTAVSSDSSQGTTQVGRKQAVGWRGQWRGSQTPPLIHPRSPLSQAWLMEPPHALNKRFHLSKGFVA